MSHNRVSVSIIIVTYNAECFIGAVLNSLINKINNQTEVIIVDGLSADNTVKIATEYNFISKIISEKDSGIYEAMNKGVAYANGEFILFLGADDELLIDIDELTVTFTDKKAVYYGNVLKSPANEIYSGEFNLPKLLNKNICHQSIFYPRSLLLQHAYNLKYKFMADYVLNMQLWSSKIKFNYINKIIARYNIEGASSFNIDNEFKKDAFKIVYRYFGLKGVAIKSFNPIKNILESAFK